MRQLNWDLCLGSCQTAIRVSVGCVLTWRIDWGRVYFSAHSPCWQNSFPGAVWLRTPGFCWLLIKGCSVGFLNLVAHCLNPERRISCSGLLKQSYLTPYNHRGTPHPLCHILLARVSHRPAQIKHRRAMDTERHDSLGAIFEDQLWIRKTEKRTGRHLFFMISTQTTAMHANLP